MINAIANPQMPEIGERFLGTVVKTTTFGAFISLLPGKDGLLHISEVRKLVGGKRIDNVEDVLAVGQKVQVELKKIDPRGKLSLAAVLPEGESGEQPRPPSPATPATSADAGVRRARATRDDREERGERREGGRTRSRNRRRRPRRPCRAGLRPPEADQLVEAARGRRPRLHRRTRPTDATTHRPRAGTPLGSCPARLRRPGSGAECWAPWLTSARSWSSVAGWRAPRPPRRCGTQGFEGRLVLFAAEHHLPYERPAAVQGLPQDGGEPRRRLRPRRGRGTPRTTSSVRTGHRGRRGRPRRPRGRDRRRGADPLRPAAAGHRELAAPPHPARGRPRRGAVAAHHRGQRPAPGGPEARRARRLRRRRLDRAGGRRRRRARPVPTVTVLESLDLPLVRVLGADSRRRCSPTCTASTASTCAPAVTVEAASRASTARSSGVRLADGTRRAGGRRGRGHRRGAQRRAAPRPPG